MVKTFQPRHFYIGHGALDSLANVRTFFHEICHIGDATVKPAAASVFAVADTPMELIADEQMPHAERLLA